jgi:hypothetical protein
MILLESRRLLSVCLSGGESVAKVGHVAGGNGATTSSPLS